MTLTKPIPHVITSGFMWHSESHSDTWIIAVLKEDNPKTWTNVWELYSLAIGALTRNAMAWNTLLTPVTTAKFSTPICSMMTIGNNENIEDPITAFTV